MTAINCLVTRDGSTGYLLSDTAMAAAAGETTPIGFTFKSVTLPHSKSVCAFRGTHAFLVPMAILAASFASFDEMASGFGPRWFAAMAQTPEAFRKSDIVGMGWSESNQRVRAFVARSTGDFTPEFHDLILCPDISLEEVHFSDFDGRVEFFNVEADLLRIMKAQRARALRADDIDSRGVIGGAAVLTIINRHESSQRVIHRWPDVIGQPINLTST